MDTAIIVIMVFLPAVLQSYRAKLLLIVRSIVSDRSKITTYEIAATVGYRISTDQVFMSSGIVLSWSNIFYSRTVQFGCIHTISDNFEI